MFFNRYCTAGRTWKLARRGDVVMVVASNGSGTHWKFYPETNTRGPDFACDGGDSGCRAVRPETETLPLDAIHSGDA